MKSYSPHPIADIFPLITGNDFVDLKADILANGLHEPIVVYEEKILDGRNRFRACQDVGVTPKFEHYNGDDPSGYVLSLNLHRRHLDESQRAMVGAKLANLDKHSFRGNQSVPANLREATTQAQAAEKLNVSERSITTAKKVQRNGVPELIDAVEQGEVSVSTAATIAGIDHEEQQEIIAKGEKEILQAAKKIRADKAAVNRRERIDRIAEISQGNVELKSDRRYPVIYADPPWRYDYAETKNRAIENQYPTMALDDICALEVPANDDAILFLWTTSPKLTEGLCVLASWGFTYRTCAIWDKLKIGMGYYFRQQHELLLVGSKGNLPAPLPADRPSSVFSFPRGEHSAKPLQVAELIEAMYPDLPKLELFCRSPRSGWDVWGNQSDS